MNKSIRICTLIRNRDWIIPLYLQHLYNLQYNKKQITLYWLVNNSNDNSLYLLNQFKSKYNSEYNKIIIKVKNKLNLVEDVRLNNVRIDGGIYEHLANMRNEMFNDCEEDYLFNIDSDILVEKECLNKLLKSEKDMIAGWIYNGYVFSETNPGTKYFNYTNLCIPHIYKVEGMERFGHINLRRRDIKENLRNNNNIIEVGLTGAICLYSRKLYSDKDIRFKYCVDGEDAPYCISARMKGFKLYGNLTSYSQHIMSQSWLNKYLNKEKID